MAVFGLKAVAWEKLAQIPPGEQRNKIIQALSVFAGKMEKLSRPGIKTQGAEPTFHPTPPVIEAYSAGEKVIDRGYEALFKLRDMTTSKSKTFEIMDIQGRIIFYQQLPGEEAKLSKLPTAGRQDVTFLRFTGGFAILDDWLRYNDVYKIDDLTEDTILEWYAKKAALAYGLIEILDSGINQPFDTTDMTTINNACATIQENMKNAGYPGMGGDVSFYILANPWLKERLTRALISSFILPNDNNSTGQVVHNIRGVVTSTYVAKTHYYVILPGYKSYRGEWENLNMRPAQRNELVLGADHVWTGAYNFALAEPRQYRRCALS